MSSVTCDIEVIDSLEAVEPAQWNALNIDHSPFLRHEFLVALERHGAVGERFGWFPRFLVAHDRHGSLVGAMPLYAKNNSYGELVFDWSWADAFHRHGVRYYPKLVSAIPYTPATGRRLLVPNGDAVMEARLAKAALTYCHENSFSGLHCLFPESRQLKLLEEAGMSVRHDVQYHWHNADYHSFQDFLSSLRRDKRKKIKQERRRVREKNVRVDMLSGSDLDEDQWELVHRYYVNTFTEKSGYATLNAGFWKEIGDSMGEQIVIAMACLDEKPVAMAINFCSRDVLYGRHWGCHREAIRDIPGLHFETCYYRGIEYAIQHGLKRFEPGAQGQHKISRGFDPSFTYSAHWITRVDFRQAIDQFLQNEIRAMQDFYRQLSDSSAYKKKEVS